MPKGKQRVKLLNKIKLAEAQLARAKHEIDLAKQAGLVTEITAAEDRLIELETKISQLKIVYGAEPEEVMAE